MKQPLGVILAGGQATRMGGGDKGLLRLGDRAMLEHVVQRLTPQVGKIALNANGDAGRWSDFDVPVLPDSISGFPGPLAGVLAGLDWAYEQSADHIVTVAADTPFYPRDLVAQLQVAAQAQASDIAIAATQGPSKVFRHPTFGLWPVALREDLRGAIQDGVRKVVLWADQHDPARAMFPAQAGDPFFNVNTPDDLIKAEAML